MFGWLKNIGKATSHTFVSHIAKNCWKECFTEAAALGGPRHHDRDFWEDVIGRFIQKWRQIHRDAPNTLETRCDVYLSFMDEVVLDRSHYPAFTGAELERIGEFIAVAIVRDLQEAIIADAERAALVFDLLPGEWLDAANLDAERFDAWYLAQTGKQRVHRH